MFSLFHRIVTGETTEGDAQLLVLIMWFVLIVGFGVGALVVLNSK